MSQAPPYDGKLEPKINQPKDLPALLAECEAAHTKIVLGPCAESDDPDVRGTVTLVNAYPTLRAEIERLKKLLDRDHTGMASALNAIRKTCRGYYWIQAGEWGSYEYSERTLETLRREVGQCLDEVSRIARVSLNESGDRAIAAFFPEKDRIATLTQQRDDARTERDQLRDEVERLGAQLTQRTEALLWVAAIALKPLVCEFDPAGDDTADYIRTVFDVKAICLALGLYSQPSPLAPNFKPSPNQESPMPTDTPGPVPPPSEEPGSKSVDTSRG